MEEPACGSTDRAALIEKYRDVEVRDNDWSRWYEHAFKVELSGYGIDCDHVYWSGFWSQGDGAGFTGRVEDAFRFLKAVDPDKTYTMVQKLATYEDGYGFDADIRFDVSNRSNFTIARVNIGSFAGAMRATDDEFRYNICKAWDEALNKEFPEFEQAVIAFARDVSNKFYRQLEKEYYYLTSDEAVGEFLDANNITE